MLGIRVVTMDLTSASRAERPLRGLLEIGPSRINLLSSMTRITALCAKVFLRLDTQ
jgi:hypothetical protein